VKELPAACRESVARKSLPAALGVAGVASPDGRRGLCEEERINAMGRSVAEVNGQVVHDRGCNVEGARITLPATDHLRQRPGQGPSNGLQAASRAAQEREDDATLEANLPGP